jgi:prevent-host-death family protein
MVIVNVHEAKTQLSRLLLKVWSGEEVIIARDGKPVARLVPYETKPKKDWIGSQRGKIWISPNFDDEVDPESWGLDEIPD